jgi:hypothetical protein
LNKLSREKVVFKLLSVKLLKGRENWKSWVGGLMMIFDHEGTGGVILV